MNKVQVLGRLGRDPEVKTMQSGDKVASFSLAVTESWKDKTTGEKKEKTEWIPVVVFGGAVNVIEKYAQKGNRLLVEGKFQTRSWEKDGEKKYTTEVVIQGFNGSVQIIDWPKQDLPQSSAQEFVDDMDDSEIPF